MKEERRRWWNEIQRENVHEENVLQNAWMMKEIATKKYKRSKQT